MVVRYLSLFLFYINIKIGKNRCLMLDWPVWETAFTLLSLVGSLMASFCVMSFFPLDVLGEIWDAIESGSEGFLTYSYIKILAWSLVSCALKTVQVLQLPDFKTLT